MHASNTGLKYTEKTVTVCCCVMISYQAMPTWEIKMPPV